MAGPKAGVGSHCKRFACFRGVRPRWVGPLTRPFARHFLKLLWPLIPLRGCRAKHLSPGVRVLDLGLQAEVMVLGALIADCGPSLRFAPRSAVRDKATSPYSLLRVCFSLLLNEATALLLS